MKKLLLLLSFSVLIFQFALSQTNISGGIYSNTTWTLANSPYVLVDTVVVFPNVTLTIEPGVVVEFADSIQLEIRQAQLIAVGTITDSITFTSRDSTPALYSGIYLNGGAYASKFDFCNISYAMIGIKVETPQSDADTVIVNNSIFEYNYYGMQFNGVGNFQVAYIDSSIFRISTYDGLTLNSVPHANINFCDFSNNTSNGLSLTGSSYPTMTYCNFSNNGNGLLLGVNTISMGNCHFFNNNIGMQETTSFAFQGYGLNMRNCVFENNQTGLYSIHFSLDSCRISNNQTGIFSSSSVIINSTIDSNNVLGISSNSDYIGNCMLRYNGIGINASSTTIDGNIIEHSSDVNVNALPDGGTTIISGNTIQYAHSGIRNNQFPYVETLNINNNIIADNDTGIILNNSVSTIRCNTFCNNSVFDLVYGAVSNINANFNYWCAADSASTENVIYDGYDNINYGLVNFMPFDSACALFNSVNEIDNSSSFTIYPNPAGNQFTIRNWDKKLKEIKIVNVEGQVVYSDKINGESFTINCAWQPGIYFVQISDGNKWLVKKLAIQ